MDTSAVDVTVPPNPGRLYVCRTCVRDARLAHDACSAGEELAATVIAAARGEGIEVRVVECLNACRSPCSVALRGTGKPMYRFSRVGIDDVGALVEFARSYVAQVDGRLDADALPPQLARKLTANAPSAAALAASAVSRMAA
jgi:predicted metal-binding protein